MKSLTPLILIAVSVGVFFLFIDPKYKGTHSLRDTISENQKILDKAFELRKERDDLQERYSSIDEKERETLNKILPDTVDNVRLILDINNIADEFGISLTNIGIQGGGEDNNNVIDKTNNVYGKIKLNFNVSARYNTFKEFMTALESSMRLVDIESFSVKTGEGEFYNFSVSLNTYWLR